MRLIDADLLLEQMKQRKCFIGRPSDPVCLVEDAPTIEAVPVKHGRWIKKSEESLWPIGHCSCCGELSMGTEKCIYCPNCGAKMDGEE